MVSNRHNTHCIYRYVYIIIYINIYNYYIFVVELLVLVAGKFFRITHDHIVTHLEGYSK